MDSANIQLTVRIGIATIMSLRRRRRASRRLTRRVSQNEGHMIGAADQIPVAAWA
jgi:hypothetical protein